MGGMPYKFYQGRTGVVWNITPRAVGVIINKQLGPRIVEKRISVRVEHVQKSKCRDGFIRRVKTNDAAKKAAKADKSKWQLLKRQPVQPRKGEIVDTSLTTVNTLKIPVAV